jgi:hypothetical protein
VPSSAYKTLGAGQGRTCGKATTKNEANRVVAKRDEVRRERGWRCGGILPCAYLAIYLKAKECVDWTVGGIDVLDRGLVSSGFTEGHELRD